MSREAGRRRDPRWDGWPIAAEGVATAHYPVIDPTDPDRVANPSPWDDSDPGRPVRESVERVAAVVKSAGKTIGNRVGRPRTTG